MLNLIDGPVQGVYACKRAPHFLRAVVDTNDEKDCLDQIADLPKLTERVYVYELQGEAGSVHLHGSKISGWYALGDYKYLPGVDGEKLRDNESWQRWCSQQA